MALDSRFQISSTLRTRIHHAEAIFHDEDALTPLATNTGRPWGDRRQQPQSITGCTEHDARQAHRGGTTVTVCAVGDLSKLTSDSGDLWDLWDFWDLWGLKTGDKGYYWLGSPAPSKKRITL